MKSFFYLIFSLATCQLFAQNIGIGTPTPAAKLDINGDFAFRTTTISLTNGTNNDINTTTAKFSYFRIIGPTLAFSITGINGGVDGRIVVIENSTVQSLTISNNNIASLVNNRILTGYGVDVLISPNGTATLQYNKTDNRWIVNSINSSQLGYWNLNGNAGTNPGPNFIGTTDAKNLTFKTNNIEHLRITTQGRIGINPVTPLGTYYPFHRIEIQDSTGLNSDIVIRTASASGYNGVPAWVSMKSNGTLQVPTKVNYQDYLGESYYYGHDGSAFRLAAVMDVNIDSTAGFLDVPTRFSFWTTKNGLWYPEERMRISNNGDIWFANKKAVLKTDQSGSIELGARDSLMKGLGTPYIDFHWDTLAQNYNVRMINNANKQLEILFAEGSGILKVNGTVLASCGTLICSDARYKTHISLLPNVLSSLSQLNGYTYNWKEKEFPDKGFNENLQIGLLAQEVEKVYPALVFTDKDGYKSVDYARLTPVLLQAIKEQQQSIEKQEKRIETLEKQNKMIWEELKNIRK